MAKGTETPDSPTKGSDTPDKGSDIRSRTLDTSGIGPETLKLLHIVMARLI